MGLSWNEKIAETAYVVSGIFFIFTLHCLSKVETARRGNAYGMFGMLLAIVGTLFSDSVDSYIAVPICIVIGFVIGGVLARIVKMTQMPQLVAVLNAFGGLAAAIEGIAAILEPPDEDGGELVIMKIFIIVGVVVGMVTFFGSIIAMLKLSEVISGKPVLIPGRNFINIGIALSWVVFCGLLLATDNNTVEFIYVLIVTVTSSLVGIHFVMAIGGADMPVVVSMLNSCSGWAGCSTGFMLSHNLLLITGALVGASGWILSVIMCRAMNRSFMNVIFGQWGDKSSAAAAAPVEGAEQLEAVPISADDTADALLKAKRIVIVPGYGMAVAKAQGSVAEITRMLRQRKIQVVFGIHPVAGRLPGHMNVLLSESKVPYDIVLEMDEVNPDFEDKTDVALVIGANDIVNPAAEEDPTSSIAGMPVIQVWRAKTCIVFKRSLRPGYAGVENPLFFRPNTRMLFGDAKDSVDKIMDAIRRLSPQGGAGAADDVELDVVGEGANLLSGVEEEEEPIVATGLTVGVVSEIRPGEMRVALTPDVSKRILKMNFKVLIQSGAGEHAHFRNEAYERIGCQIAPDAQTVFDTADILIKIRAPMMNEELGKHEVDMMHAKQVVISFVQPAQNSELLERMTKKGVTSIAVDCVPRITTAQRLDVLSSMAKIGGYRAVIEAANHFGRFFGGEITAAGKVPPCKVLVIGAGVAGLSAIGTAHAMGAIVRAFDTRPVVKEEVMSMGAEFLEVDFEEEGAGSGGYARVMSPEFIKAEMALFAAQCREVDIIVTTALIPGRKAPILITKDMVESMANGSVVVDMAAENGGNCEVTRPNEVYKYNGVTIVGISDLPSRMARQSSEMYARNMANMLDEMSGGKSDDFSVNMENKIIRGCCVVHKSEVTWPPPTIEPSAAPARAAGADDAVPAVIERAPVKERDLLYMVVITILLFAAGIPSPDSFLPLMMVFVLACVVGWKIIWNVAAALHTPLMSVTNSVSGIVLVGAMIQLSADMWSATMILAIVACIISSINISGGFLVTQRMLGFFSLSED